MQDFRFNEKYLSKIHAIQELVNCTSQLDHHESFLDNRLAGAVT